MDEMIQYITRSARGIAGLTEQASKLDVIGDVLSTALANGNKLLMFGNGGSAAHAQHFAAELVVKFKRSRRAQAAICLNSDVSSMTACGNDFGYNEIFARQVDALARKGDVLVAFTTSGRSQNILNALSHLPPECTSVVFTGRDGGIAKDLAHYVLRVDSIETAVIQDAHQVILHALSDYIERHL